MSNVVIAKAKVNGNIYYLDSNSKVFLKNDNVVIETENGLILGVVLKSNYDEDDKNLDLPLNKIVRLATEEDIKNYNENICLTEAALKDARKLSKNLSLEMNFVDCYYNLDKTQLIFSFLSENRVDFRELAKKLASKYKTRIELRQIGVRDKAKRIGGFGPCGLFLCCNSFLTDFNSVSINMAKNQFLALNPSKINGLCGRLLCCLDYENDVYTELKKDLPKIGMMAETPMGMGKVISVDVFRKSYRVDLKDKGIVEFFKDK